MSRTYSFTVPYSAPVTLLHRAYTDPEAWRARFAEAKSANYDLEHPDGEGSIRIHMSERVGGDAVPKVVRSVLGREFTLERTDTWNRLDGERATGFFTAATTGVRGELAGDYLLRPTAEGAVLEISGEAKFDVPVVGGALERMVEQLHQRVVQNEREFFGTWLAEHPEG
ncbi:DUF2505 domain-containing protein [Nocardia asteroides]|uniref:DUF2505 domain-containing protein n=1 Tax=Nocardia asteroides TaxID=1824 RepID=UPI001E612688|nr:DUF2505 domain-containing protein [Nocardia asteroides]UGT64621.1 DUF2505 domain-containing protein [Nocardia asteroides]